MPCILSFDSSPRFTLLHIRFYALISFEIIFLLLFVCELRSKHTHTHTLTPDGSQTSLQQILSQMIRDVFYELRSYRFYRHSEKKYHIFIWICVSPPFHQWQTHMNIFCRGAGCSHPNRIPSGCCSAWDIHLNVMRAVPVYFMRSSSTVAFGDTFAAWIVLLFCTDCTASEYIKCRALCGGGLQRLKEVHTFESNVFDSDYLVLNIFIIYGGRCCWAINLPPIQVSEVFVLINM